MVKRRRRRKNYSANILIFMCLLLICLLIISRCQACNHDDLAATNNPTSDKATNNTSSAAVISQPAVSSSAAANLTDLVIDYGEAVSPGKAGLRKWPEQSCIEIIHQADLQQYRGRSSDQQPLKGILIILDPGHGGQDSGACYPPNAAQPTVIEKTVTLAVGLKTRTALEKLGATVIMTRENDDWVSLYKRIGLTGETILNRYKAELPAAGRKSGKIDHLQPLLDTVININSDAADSGGRGIFKGIGAIEDQRLIMDIESQYPDALFISMHCNALENDTNCSGLQVYYESSDKVYAVESETAKYSDPQANPPGYTLYDDEGRLRLATAIHDSIISELPELNYHGEQSVLDGDYAVLRETNLTNILIEMGFITNDEDRKLLQTASSQQQIADAVAQAVFSYYCR
ncbi:MAG: N-acetylmuramoyl-L-alanine amidase [Clostridiaceae bacterium]|nr:N-acetylmuramoyl-L-alanine amidase [Clostridiaceae bacterium]